MEQSFAILHVMLRIEIVEIKDLEVVLDIYLSDPHNDIPL